MLEALSLWKSILGKGEFLLKNNLVKSCCFRLQKNKENLKLNNSPVHGDHTVLASLQQPTPACPVPVPSVFKPQVIKIRNSVEGFNQEIEKLVLKNNNCKEVL